MKLTQLTVALAACLLASCASLVGPEPTTLRDAAKGSFKMGVALPYRVLRDAQASGNAGREFNRLVCENEMKFESLQPREGQFTFEQADALVKFAEEHDMEIHFHTLVWHAQTPQWVFRGPDGQQASKELVLQRLKTHIKTVMEHYKGKIATWDVVNEAYNQDGSLRFSPWRSALGDDYLRICFQAAREADPKAVLIYNDFDMPHKGKREAVAKMFADFKKEGIIDGLGLQTHWNATWPTMEDAEATLKAFSDVGAKIYISEMDINTQQGMRNSGLGLVRTSEAEGGQGAIADPDQALADRYAQLFGLFLKYKKNVEAVTLWGIADHYSWIHGQPLIFDSKNEKKKAYFSVLETLKKNR